MRLKIGAKMALAIGTVGLLLIVCGIVGYTGAAKLTSELTFITTKAWDSADGAMEGVIGIQRQLIEVEKINKPGISDEVRYSHKEALEEAVQLESEALNRMKDAGLIGDEKRQRLDDLLAVQDQVRLDLLERFEKFDVAYRQLFNINAKLLSELINADSLADTPHSREAQIQALNAVNKLQHGLLNEVNIEIEVYERILTEMKEDIRSLSNSLSARGGEAVNAVERIKKLSGMYETKLIEALTELNSFHVSNSSYSTSTAALLAYVDELEELGDSQVEGKVSEIEKITSAVKVAIIFTLVIGVVLGLVIIWLSKRSIVEPIQKITLQMRDIAEGEGDLTVRLNEAGYDEIADLSRGFNAYTAKIHSMVAKVTDAIAQLSAASEQTAQITAETRNAIERQCRESEDVASSVTEMAQASEEVARSAEGAATAIQNADEQSRSGARIVGDTMQAIHALADEVGEASETITLLAQQSEKIGNILDVIRSVAEQTNLLALNAAIEAARAGEQGRGFAVVADEVRTLAKRTQTSTVDIQSIINRLQEGTDKAVAVMESSRQKAQNSVSQFDAARVAFGGIAEAVGTAAGMATQIAAAAEEQNAVSVEIGRNVSNISDISRQNAKSAQQVMEANVSVAQLAVQLQTLVGSFKI